MFLGEYERTVDEKGRVTIPAKFRSELSQGLAIVCGLKGCLLAYPLSEWDALVRRARQLSSDKTPQLFRLLASATVCNLDKKGRILLPASFRRYTAIENEVVIVGLHSYFEIWSKERWDSVKRKISQP
jgi:MraZ protein